MTDYVIAIDGGGTSCRAAVADREGRTLGRGQGGSANIFSRSEQAAENIIAASMAALDAAGLKPGILSQAPAFLGLAGWNVGSHRDALARALPFRECRFAHDGLIALQGAHGDADGVIAIFGTGSAYVSRKGGMVRSRGGWGFAVGDQASGAVLGRALLQEVLLAHDGIRPQSPLSHSVLARFDGDPAALVEFATYAKPADYGSFAPQVLAADEEGDPLARILLDVVARDFTAALDAAVFEGCERLSLLGGLAPFYRKRLAPRHEAILTDPLGDALSGAVQLALRSFHPSIEGAG